MQTTPKEIGANVFRLREKIGLQTEPVFVSVRDTSGHRIDDCFFNVLRKIETDGGSIRFGWMVWEDPDRIIEGVFHAVWVHPNGDLIDITPKQDRERNIVFIPDPNAVYEEKPVDSVRIALTNDPDVLASIRYHEGMTELRAKYNVRGESTIPGWEVRRLMARAFDISPQSLPPVAAPTTVRGVGRNDPCPCGSGLKFKKCHGRKA